MIELKLNEESSITLEMELHGDMQKDAKPELRFSILDENMRYSILAKRIDNGIYKIDFPKLMNIFESKIYDIEVELIVDGKHFIPVTEQVKFKKELKADVKIKEDPIKESVIIATKPTVSIVSIDTNIVNEEIKHSTEYTIKKLNKTVKI